MRKTLMVLLVALVSVIVIAAPFAFTQYVSVNTSTTAPKQLTNANFYVRSVTIWGKKGYQTTNTSTVHVGTGSSANGDQGIAIDPGGAVTIRSVDGRATLQLSNLWYDVQTANDGVMVYYEP